MTGIVFQHKNMHTSKPTKEEYPKCKKCGKERKTRLIITEICGACLNLFEKVILPKEIEKAKEKHATHK